MLTWVIEYEILLLILFHTDKLTREMNVGKLLCEIYHCSEYKICNEPQIKIIQAQFIFKRLNTWIQIEIDLNPVDNQKWWKEHLIRVKDF